MRSPPPGGCLPSSLVQMTRFLDRMCGTPLEIGRPCVALQSNPTHYRLLKNLSHWTAPQIDAVISRWIATI